MFSTETPSLQFILESKNDRYYAALDSDDEVVFYFETTNSSTQSCLNFAKVNKFSIEYGVLPWYWRCIRKIYQQFCKFFFPQINSYKGANNHLSKEMIQKLQAQGFLLDI